MNKSLRRRVAAVATTATVGGLLLPFLAAGSALAAEPTGITAAPATQTVAVGATTATVTGTLTAGSTGVNKVYYRIPTGPDMTAGTTGKNCPLVGLNYTCTIAPNPANSVPGTDSIQVFYDLNANGNGTTANYQTQDPAATASVIFAGPATKTTVTPTTARTSTGSTASYTVSGTDSVGNPASGTVAVSLSQTVPAAVTTDPLKFTDPSVSTVFPAAAGGPGVLPGAQPTPTTLNSNTTYTHNATFTFANGAVNIGVASSAAGTVAFAGGTNSATLSAGSASLAVSAGNTTAGPATTPNDDNAAALTPATDSASFTTKPVTSVVTIKNASGDPLGGVSVFGLVTSGPNKNTTANAALTTDQLGHATLSYTANGTTGTDTLLAWVNQSTHPNGGNTPAADTGEPQGATSVTLSAAPPTPVITSTKDTQTVVSVTQTSTPVTYTLKSAGVVAPGYNLNFTIDTSAGKSTAGKAFTVTPASAVTDSNGAIAVTVFNPAPAATDKIFVIATLAGDPSTSDVLVELDYAAAAATTATVTPTNQSLVAGSKVTVTANVLDQSAKPFSGAAVSFAVAGRNGPAANANASGVATTDARGNASFTYTDVGTPVPAGTAPTDRVTAAVTGIGAVPFGTATFVPGTATTSTVGLTVGAGVATTTSTVTTTNPTAVNPTANVIVVKAQPRDISTNILYNKTVTFTSTGVGTFTDSSGNPIGNSTTAQVDGTSGFASVNVRSTAPGTETIFASADTTSSNTVTVTYTSGFASITPERVLDTRTGQGSLTIAGGGNAPQRLAPNTNYTFNIAATDLPQGQAAYAFNVTAIGADRVGNLRIASTCTTANSPTPTTSLIGYQPGADVANFVVVANNNTSGANPVPCNTFTIYSDGSGVSVAIDAVGYYSAAGITAITPSRIVDTRTGQGGSNGPLAAGSRHFFQVAPAVAPGATQPVKAVALNVTAINPSGLGYLQVYPDGATQPTASNINYIPGVDKAAFVIVNVPANGQIDVYSAGSSAGVAIDLFATFPASTSTLVTSAPVRVLDTRLTANTINANGTLNVQVTGAASVPADAQAVLVSLTAIHTTGGTGVGNLRAYPAGGVLPTVSTVNYVSSTSDVANFAIVKLGTNGQLSLYSDGSPIDVAVDVVGYVPAG